MADITDEQFLAAEKLRLIMERAIELNIPGSTSTERQLAALAILKSLADEGFGFQWRTRFMSQG